MINNIILASKSGVRKKILNKNGINCEVIPANIDEDQIKKSLLQEKASPEIISKNLAELKANKISKKKNDYLVLGADSVIDLNGELISKPSNREEALNILEKLNLLVEEGAISEIQYLEQKNKVSEIESKLIENSVTLKYQIIKSPIKGYVFDLKPQKSGYVAINGEPLMKIVPMNKLQAKIEINSEKIGFVRVGQKADISIDSYPATDFGVIQGEITRIGSDALTPEPSLGKGFRFPADIKIEEQFLTLKNGKKLPLQTGMSLTANVKLRKVSYLQLLLGTFRDKADSLRSM